MRVGWLLFAVSVCVFLHVANSCWKVYEYEFRKEKGKMYPTQMLQLLETVLNEENANVLLQKYSMYGCYCGLGGAGTPLDAVDICCQAHDGCYNDVEKKNGIFNFPLIFTEYKFMVGDSQTDVTCVKGDPGVYGYAPYEKCECDKTLAKCFAENRNIYKAEYTKMTVLSGMCPLRFGQEKTLDTGLD